MRILPNVYQSLDAIKANIIRIFVIIFIISLGITTLVMIPTVFNGLTSTMVNSFSSLGTNTFQIENRASAVVARGRNSRRVRYPSITYRQAVDFKERMGDDAAVSIGKQGYQQSTVRYGSEQTNPTMRMYGTDENGIKTARYNLVEGRGITRDDLNLSRKVAVLGFRVKDKLFKKASPLGEMVSVDGTFFKVIGVLEEMGTTFNQGADKIVIMPITTFRAMDPYPNATFSLSVYAEDPTQITPLMDQARGIFRIVRKRKPNDPNNFSLISSDGLTATMNEQMSVLTLAGTLISFITLLGASIALLNVMLVSVTERTNEIGIRKAMGATKNGIMIQFLTEAIVICQLGGLLGIFFGLALGNWLSNSAFDTTFAIPWAWIITGIAVCTFVGLTAGMYPAWKAAKVDPIESLRYE